MLEQNKVEEEEENVFKMNIIHLDLNYELMRGQNTIERCLKSKKKNIKKLNYNFLCVEVAIIPI